MKLMQSPNILIFILIGMIISVTLLNNSAFGELTLATDNHIYFPNDLIFIEGNLGQRISGYDDVTIKIIDPNNDILLDHIVELQPNNKFEYHSLRSPLSDVDGLYTVQAEYEDQVSTLFFYFTNSVSRSTYDNSTILSLDKDMYSWTDKVEVTLVAPLLNSDSNEIEIIGSDEPYLVEIQGLEKIERYPLVETISNSGIFHGIIQLTGMSSIDANGDGKRDDVSGTTTIIAPQPTVKNPYAHLNGPFETFVGAKDGMKLQIIFETPGETITRSADVSWNKGEIDWAEDFLLLDTTAHLYVMDADMNFHPDNRDKLYVKVERLSEKISKTAQKNNLWDESIKQITLHETDNNTGVFKGSITIVTNTSEKGNSKIYALDGEQISVQYNDYTVPHNLNILSNPLAIKSIISICALEEFCNAVEIPKWVKNNAAWWAEGQIDDDAFVQGIQFMIKKNILEIPPAIQGPNSDLNSIPKWVKNNAAWWAEGQIDDDAFVQGIQFMIKEGIMKINN